MQTPEFANQIFSLKLNSIIAAKLGLDNVQDPAVEVFSKSLVYHLNRKQYVEDDVHKYTYTWDVNDQKSDYKYELTRTVKIYGQDNIHELDSIASGKFEYVLQVGQDNCYSYKAKKDSKPPTQLPKPVGKDKDITCGVGHRNKTEEDILFIAKFAH